MCSFLSALVFRNGTIITAPEYTDSHSDLILANNFNDDNLMLRHWIRVEFTSETMDKPETYQLTVDESAVPDWFDDELRESTSVKLRRMIEKMIVNDTRKILLGGCWILTEGANVEVARNAAIKIMQSNSRVGVLRGNSRVVIDNRATPSIPTA